MAEEDRGEATHITPFSSATATAERKLTKLPELGHLEEGRDTSKKTEGVRYKAAEMNAGDEVKVDVFAEGDRDVTGISKGHGQASSSAPRRHRPRPTARSCGPPRWLHGANSDPSALMGKIARCQMGTRSPSLNGW